MNIFSLPSQSDSKPETESIDRFTDEFQFLSNFHPARVVYEGIEYPSTEHAYQAAKTDDQQERLEFVELTAAEAKKKGKEVIVRRDWNDIKIGVMEELVRDKFTRHPHLALKLMATEDLEIVEGNTWGDTFWGVCNGKGHNHLGRILMKIRKELNDQKNS